MLKYHDFGIYPAYILVFKISTFYENYRKKNLDKKLLVKSPHKKSMIPTSK